MCQLPPKRAKYCEKNEQFFDATVSKKVKFVKFGVKKANLATLWNRGGLHSLFHC